MKTLSDLIKEIDTAVVEYVMQLFPTQQGSADALGITRRALVYRLAKYRGLNHDSDVLIFELESALDKLAMTVEEIKGNLLKIEELETECPE
jgi:hypothetical protein